MTDKVYRINELIHARRPGVVVYDKTDDRFSHDDAGWDAYSTNANVGCGDEGYTVTQWLVPNLVASDRGKTAIGSWDYYMCSTTLGVVSPKLIETFQPFFGDRLELLPANFEGLGYSCLRCCRKTDCLNKTKSEIVYFDEDDGDAPDNVMDIELFVFNKDELMDNMIFSIPEISFGLFCTDGIPEVAAEAGLKGIEFKLVDPTPE